MGGLKALATGARDAAAQFETMRTEFEVLTGSAEQGSALFEQIRSFSSRTPMSMGSLNEAAKQLMSFGTATGDVVDQLQMLGDISLGNEAKMERLTRAFGKVQARGKASMEELNQIMEAGVPIISELAEQLGVSEERVFEMTSAGKIGFDELTQAMRSMTEEGGQFNRGMERLSETFSGKLSTAMDNVKVLLATIGERGLPMLKEALDTVTRIVQDLTLLLEHDALGRYLRIVGTGVWEAVKSIFSTENFGQITNQIGNSVVQIMESTARTFIAMFGHAADVITGTAERLGEDWLKHLMNGIVKATTVGQRGILRLLGIADLDGTPFDVHGPGWGATMAEEFVEEVPEIAETYKSQFQAVAGAWQDVLDAMGDATNPAMETMRAEIDALLADLRALQEESAQLSDDGGPAGGGGSGSDPMSFREGSTLLPLQTRIALGQVRGAAMASLAPDGVDPLLYFLGEIKGLMLDVGEAAAEAAPKVEELGGAAQTFLDAGESMFSADQIAAIEEYAAKVREDLTPAAERFREEADLIANAEFMGLLTEDEAAQAMDRLIEKFPELRSEAQALRDSFAEIGQALGDIAMDAVIDQFREIGAALQQGTFNAESMATAMGNVLLELLNAMPTLFLSAGLNLLATNPAMWPIALGFIVASGASAIGSGYANSYAAGDGGVTASASGNVFSGGRLVPFASGGIVGGPTIFPMANGGVGLMGEAGPEAVVPLTRTRDGNLGVASDGGGTQVVVNNYTGEQVSTRERRGPNGQKQLEIMVGHAVARKIADGTLDSVMRTNYGVRRRGQ